ncbi:MAG TPA: N-acetyltransferase [Burkholderiales bacterium]|nr:N-acetyltransferase [Burkholderiales bacterium]
MLTLDICLATEADAQSIAVMSRCLIELGLRGWSWDPARVTRAIRNRDTCVAVAQIDRHVEGFAIAEFGDTRMHLSLLAVAATHQRRGLGRALVAWLEKSALTAGITEMQLELRANNPGAKFFYQALGFEFVRAIPGYYSGEETAFRMRKAINARTAGPIES